MESSSPSSDSSKVSKWRPGMGFNVREPRGAGHPPVGPSAREMYQEKPQSPSPDGLLEHHLDIGRTFAREQIYCHAGIVAAQDQVEPAAADAQAAHHQPVVECGQTRLAQ